MNLSFVEYISNPYSVIAAITAIMGISFKIALSKIKKPSANLIKSMYAMFLAAAVSLGLSVLGIVFFLQGTGARDDIASSLSWLIPTAYAEKMADSDEGWVWAGEVNRVPYFVDHVEELYLASPHFKITHPPIIDKSNPLATSNQQLVTKDTIYLRATPPKFSWWFFRYRLGELLGTYPPGQEFQVIAHHISGKQWWLKVRIDN